MTNGTLTHAQITSALEEAMLGRGWSLRSFSRLPKVFAKESVVTPFYGVGRIHRTGDGWYGLDGYIGVVHQEFEEQWAMRDANHLEQPLFPCVLLIANLRELSRAAYVKAATLAEDMEAFATVLDRHLSKMPHTESDLYAAFVSGSLCGRPIESFSGYSQRPKFAEFRRSVLSGLKFQFPG